MSHSTLLFAMPSFLEGMARSVDIGGTLTEFNSSLTGQQADALAVWGDWRAVGVDLQTAADQFAAEHPQVKSREQKK